MKKGNSIKLKIAVIISIIITIFPDCGILSMREGRHR